MNKLLSLLFLSLLSITAFSQGVAVTESFDATTFAPNGWTIKPDLAAQNIWVRRTSGTNGNVNVCATHSGAGLARFTSRVVAAGTKQVLVSKVVDYSNRNSAATSIDFWMFRDSFSANNADSLTVWISTTDTLDANAVRLGAVARNRSINLPDVQAVNSWYNYAFSVPANFNGAANYFLFEGTSQTATINQGANIFMDDVSYTEYPPACTGIPNVGNVVAPASTICGGGGQLNLSLSNPINNASGLTYVWEESANGSAPWTSFGTNASTALTNVLSANTYVRCTVTCSASSSSYSTPSYLITVSSNPNPTVLVSPSPAAVCAGNPATLLASGAASYIWLPAVLTSSTSGDSVTVLPAANTQYIVTGSDANGCTASTTVNVTISNPPQLTMTATPGTVVCKGQQVVLNCVNGPANGLTFLWSDGKTSRRDTIVVSNDMTLSVQVTNQFGCTALDSIAISVDTTSVVDFTYTQSGNTFTFTDITTGSTNWNWTFGDGNSSTNQNPVYTYSSAGTYTVTLTVTGNCGTSTIEKVIGVWPEALHSNSSTASLVLYPVPAQDILNIQAKDVAGIRNLELYNMLGKLVWSKTIHANELITVSLADFSKGIYYLRAGNYTAKFEHR